MPEDRSSAQVEEAAQALADWLTWYPEDGPPEPVETEEATEPAEGEVVETEEAPPTPEFTFVVEVVDSPAELIRAMCGSDEAVIGWLDAWNYLVVDEMDCAEPRFIVETGRGLDAGTVHMEPVYIIANAIRWVSTRGAPIQTLSDLRGQSFCRTTDDPAVWRVVSLMLLAGGVDPIDIGQPDSLGQVIDYEDLEEMVRQIYNTQGACIAGVVPADWLDQTEDLRSQLYNFDNQVKEFATSAAIPNPVMVYPPTVTLTVREYVDEVLTDRDTDMSLFETLIYASDLVEVEEDTFDAFRDFFESAGLNPLMMSQ